MREILERFKKYIAIETMSDPNADVYPSTESQREFGSFLVKDLLEIGIEDAMQDENGVVYAHIDNKKEKYNICEMNSRKKADDYISKLSKVFNIRVIDEIKDKPFYESASKSTKIQWYVDELDKTIISARKMSTLDQLGILGIIFPFSSTIKCNAL